MLKLFFKFSIGTFVSTLISFFTVPVTTLLISPENFGKSALFTFAYNIFNNVVLFGLDQSFMRFFFEDNKKEEKKSFLWSYLVFSILIWLLLSLVLLFWGNNISQWMIGEDDIRIVYLLCFQLLIGLFNRYVSLILRMKKKGLYYSLLQIVSSIINVIVIILTANFIINNFYAILFGGVVSLFFTTILGTVWEREFIFAGWKFSRVQFLKMLKYGYPFLFVGVMTILFGGLDKIFIRRFENFENLGLYSSALKITSVFTILKTGFSTFWTPLSIEYYSKNPEKTELYETAYRYMSFILIICGLLLIGFKDIFKLLLDSKYHDAIPIMPFLIFTPIMYILSEITQIGINFKKKTYWYMVILSVLIVVSSVLYYFLIKILGIKGAAVTMGISYMIYFLLRTSVSVKYFPMNFNLIKSVILFALLALVAAINTFCNNKILCVGSALISILICVALNIKVIKELIEYLKKAFSARLRKS